MRAGAAMVDKVLPLVVPSRAGSSGPVCHAAGRRARRGGGIHRRGRPRHRLQHWRHAVAGRNRRAAYADQAGLIFALIVGVVGRAAPMREAPIEHNQTFADTAARVPRRCSRVVADSHGEVLVLRGGPQGSLAHA